MNDVIHRNHTDENHRAFIPDFGVYTVNYDPQGNPVYYVLSRQLVIFTIERRKAWRMLQSRAGIQNPDYQEQKEYLANLDQELQTKHDALVEA